MSAFSELVVRISYEHLTCTEFVSTPIDGTLFILLKSLPPRSAPIYLRKFVIKFKNDTILLGMELWNTGIEKDIRVELAFFNKFKLRFFSAPSERDSLSEIFDNGTEWMHSHWLSSTQVETRSITSSMCKL